jgi:flagellar motor switch protein FliN
MVMGMGAQVDRILELEVPLIVQLAEKVMKLGDVTSLKPGAIVELPKSADEPLELLVNNKSIGTGNAVKVGENFGIRIGFIGDVRERIEALGPRQITQEGEEEGPSDDEAAALAEMMLSGQ